jgi:hypothetical protein
MNLVAMKKIIIATVIKFLAEAAADFYAIFGRNNDIAMVK